MKTYGIILAAGHSTRFQDSTPKQFFHIAGRTVLEHAIEHLSASSGISEIIVVTQSAYLDITRALCTPFPKVTAIISGGNTRQESVACGLRALPLEESNVIIHDSARPFVHQNIIDQCIQKLEEFPAVSTVIPSTDTIFEVEGDQVKNVPKRERMVLAQTPQGFKLSIIRKAHTLGANDLSFTDDCGLVEHYLHCPIATIPGDTSCMKITQHNDIFLAEYILTTTQLSH